MLWSAAPDDEPTHLNQRILDYGGMAGLKYALRSPQKVRDAEDELLRLVG